MTLKLRIRGAVALLALLAMACGNASSGSSDPATTLAVSDETIGAGSALYAANCAQCHGEDLRGTDRGPSHLSIVYEPAHHSDTAFRLAVQNGVRAHHFDFGPMLPIEGISETDVDAIIAFVRTEQTREGFEPYP